MQYILQNDKWQVTYTDFNGVSHTFLHPTKLTKSVDGPIDVTEEKIKEVFPTDVITQNIIDYMKRNNGKFDDESQP